MSLIVFLRNLFVYKTFFIETKYFSDYNDFIVSTSFSKEIKNKSNVVIYGFGPFGQSYFVDLFYSLNILAIVDVNYKSNNKFLKNPELIDSINFDFIIITVMNDYARKEVLDFLNKKNISEEKIVLVNYTN